MQLISYVVPLRYYFETVRGILLRGAGLPELWPHAADLLLLRVAGSAVSAARFREQLG